MLFWRRRKRKPRKRPKNWRPTAQQENDAIRDIARELDKKEKEKRRLN